MDQTPARRRVPFASIPVNHPEKETEMTMRRFLYVFILVLLGSVWLPLASAQATTSPTPGTPVIATLDGGTVLAKQGSVNGAWTTEWSGATAPGGIGAAVVSVASDPTNGPLIALADNGGNVWAKEGSLSGAWTEVWNGSPLPRLPGRCLSRVIRRMVPSSL